MRAVLAILCVVGLAYGAAWFVARDRVLAAAGTHSSVLAPASVALQAPAVEGFPLRFAMSADTASVRLADGAFGRAGAVRAVWRPWRPLSLSAVAADAVSYERPDPRGRFALSAPSGEATARWRPTGGLASVSAALAAPRLVAPGWRVDGREVRLALRTVGGDGPPGLRLDLDAADLLPAPAGPPLPGLPEGAIERLTATLTARPRPDLPLTAASLDAWRARGGTLTVDAARLDWGDLSVALDGRLGLDALLRPTGRLEARVAGGRELVEALLRAGLIRPGDAGLILGVIEGFAGAEGETVVPLRLGDGWLAIGPFPVIRLAPVI